MANSRMIFGDAQKMPEIKANSVHLVVTSPPYFNAPFDYPGLFDSYEDYLKMIKSCAKEIKRVLIDGRVVAIVIDDTLINGVKYPVVADVTKIFVDSGFSYREKITWLKPEGYTRFSRRSGVIHQHPYPMYYYPDNLQESILLLQKGKFNYKKVTEEMKVTSTVDLNEFKKKKMYLSVWNITNVLPRKNRLEKGIAAFPDEIPYRLIKLFSFKGETILDPFVGSGTTLKVAQELGRNSVGYDIDIELLDVVKTKANLKDEDVIVRKDVKRLRSFLQERIPRSGGS